MELISFLQSLSNPLLDKIFTAVTIFGEEYAAILILTVTYWCVNKEFGYKLGFALVFSFVLNGAVKDTFKVARPIGRAGIRTLRAHTATGYSFPSGHTQNTTVMWTALMVKLRRSWLYILGSAIILAVAVSRLYLGVHWPTDVIGGLLLGLISLVLANKVFSYLEHNKLLVSILLVLPLSGMVVFKSEDYAKAVGVLIGFIVGFILEKTYLKYQVNAPLRKQILKVMLGLIVALIIKVLLKEVLPATNLSHMLRYAVIGLWCIAGAPYVFKKIKLS